MYRIHDLVFLWPMLLWLLAIVPLLLFLYWRLLKRQSRVAKRFGALSPQARDSKPGWFTRHGSAVFLLLGLTFLILAIARPQAVVVLPTRVDSIILAMDISGSMRASDVKPNRLVAAQTAAKSFISQQPTDVKIGVVSIASTAALAQSPTAKREEVIETIDRFQLQKGTALGAGIVIALSTLMPDSGIDVDQVIFGRNPARWASNTSAGEKWKAVAPGSNNTVAIILISDGVSNFGPDLVEATKLAADRGVRVYTVGVGTAQGDTLSIDGFSIRVRLDEEGLKKVAAMTQGEYFAAANAAEMKKIYQQLSARLTLGKGRTTEITALFVMIGTLLALVGVLISMFRFNRVL